MTLCLFLNSHLIEYTCLIIIAICLWKKNVFISSSIQITSLPYLLKFASFLKFDNNKKLRNWAFGRGRALQPFSGCHRLRGRVRWSCNSQAQMRYALGSMPSKRRIVLLELIFINLLNRLREGEGDKKKQQQHGQHQCQCNNTNKCQIVVTEWWKKRSK